MSCNCGKTQDGRTSIGCLTLKIDRLDEKIRQLAKEKQEKLHNELGGLQGGSAGSYYHLTLEQLNLLGRVSEELQKIKDRLNTLETQLGNLSNKVDRIDNDLSGLRTRLEAVETKLNNAESAINSLTTRVGGLETKTNGLETRITQLDTDKGNIISRLNSVEAVNGTQTNEIQELRNLINNLTGTGAGLANDLNEIRSRLTNVEHGLTTKAELHHRHNWNEIDDKPDITSMINNAINAIPQSSDFLSGNSNPNGMVGKNGDHYFNTSISKLYKKETDIWNEVYTFRSGSTIISGTGVPDNSIGEDGNYFISSNGIYKKEGGVWNAVYSNNAMEVGTNPPTHASGGSGYYLDANTGIVYQSTGAGSTTWNAIYTPIASGLLHSGAGTPIPSIGKDGDNYLDTTTGHIYKKEGGNWNLIYSPTIGGGGGTSNFSAGQYLPSGGNVGDYFVNLSNGELYSYNGTNWDFLYKFNDPNTATPQPPVIQESTFLYGENQPYVNIFNSKWLKPDGKLYNGVYNNWELVYDFNKPYVTYSATLPAVQPSGYVYINSITGDQYVSDGTSWNGVMSGNNYAVPISDSLTLNSTHAGKTLMFVNDSNITVDISGLLENALITGVKASGAGSVTITGASAPTANNVITELNKTFSLIKRNSQSVYLIPL